MPKDNSQQEIWTSDFGKEYTDRSICNPEKLDELYKKMYGVTKLEMNSRFLGGLDINNILEVGCNIGDQLRHLQFQGYNNLYGIEVLKYAIQKASQLTKDINIIWGNAFNIPFKDGYFDLVFTAGVLIHVHPDDIAEVMNEIYRVSKRYIWGIEFYNDGHKKIEYRGKKNFCWKADFAQIYLDLFPDLALVKEERYKYLDNDNVDSMFLLQKKGL